MKILQLLTINCFSFLKSRFKSFITCCSLSILEKNLQLQKATPYLKLTAFFGGNLTMVCLPDDWWIWDAQFFTEAYYHDIEIIATTSTIEYSWWFNHLEKFICCISPFQWRTFSLSTGGSCDEFIYSESPLNQSIVWTILQCYLCYTVVSNVVNRQIYQMDW